MTLTEVHTAREIETRRSRARLSRGLEDCLPQEMIARQKVTGILRQRFEIHGFVPLDTPAIEYRDVLADGGDELRESTFGVISREHEALALRYELTASLARVVAQHRDLPRPFRRYQVAPVWRCDKPGKGRLREFIQFDIDSVGAPLDLADTEVIAAIADALGAVGLDAVIHLSDRRLLNGLLTLAAIPHSIAARVFRAMDKLAKIGPERLRRELTSGYEDESGAWIEGLALRQAQVDRIEAFLGVPGGSRDETLLHLRDIFARQRETLEDIDDLQRISDQLRTIDLGDDRVVIDVSVVRGLAYYTSTIFEALVRGAEGIGSVAGGGRYDNLVTRFIDERVPAVGASIGVTRLLAILKELGKLDAPKSTARVLVGYLDPSLTDDYLALTWELRRAGIPTELYLGGSTSMAKQLRYADRTGIPLVILLGSTEKAHGTVSVKDMIAGRSDAAAPPESRQMATLAAQTRVPRGEVVSAIRRMLAEQEGRHA
ncbi:MAG TPA: histidine--tRNA ligase [Thermoanaerobaculia bacterium]|nr:histidine--tRNA ligase [Thermoanaerobaculia bacterium]